MRRTRASVRRLVGMHRPFRQVSTPYDQRKHILTEQGVSGDDAWLGLNFIDPTALIVYPHFPRPVLSNARGFVR